MKKMNFVIACLRPSQNVKLGIFTGSLAVDVKNRISSGQIQLLLLIASQTFFRLVGSSFFYGENKSFPSRHKLAEQTGQVWRDSSSWVRTHEKNSGETVRRLATIIQSIFLCPTRSRHPLEFLEIVRWESVPRGSLAHTWKLSSCLFSRPDWLPLGLRGCHT